jgi:Alternative complex III, ActD subunit
MGAKNLYGLLAEFETAEEVLEAARKTYAAGFRSLDAFSPIPVEGLSEAIGFETTRLPLIVLIGGILGGLTGFFMCYYANVISWPWNIGGRPHNSWPAWIPITFELTILGAALSAVFGMFGLNKLPMPYHPVFNVATFAKASTDRFFLCIKARDRQFELARTKAFLESLHPHGVFEVDV